MKLKDFDYTYPEELVAQRPLPSRDASKMLVISRKEKGFNHALVSNLPSFFNKGDILVVNDSKVFPARLIGKKEGGGEIELLLLKEIGKNTWQALSTRKKRLKAGQKLVFDSGLTAKILKNLPDDLIVEFTFEKNIYAIIEEIGLPPLPPYIRRGSKDDYTDEDRERYQTVYARHIGSAAAPTAGFHLSKKILEECRLKGAEIIPITLHVGIDTFSPVRTEAIEQHEMHGEEYFISAIAEKAIFDAKKEGRRIIAVGTTTVRALESFFGKKSATHHQKPLSTKLFITPGYEFRMVDAILTNFHQPRSTLLMLVSAFAGREFILQTYAEAIKERYRLFSYGDCMLIL